MKIEVKLKNGETREFTDDGGREFVKVEYVIGFVKIRDGRGVTKSIPSDQIEEIVETPRHSW